ncbi:hypothetical protein [Planctomycetes bacterium K23_9]|uniref:Uncharacterized protein n=1 Tax=Stieleria marina TaxID=1930275 RepID=A0A517NYY4_9BACT|nr:hypothetical protein K239x_43510 [Planctomycetes bacterium K23_9]
MKDLIKPFSSAREIFTGGIGFVSLQFVILATIAIASVQTVRETNNRPTQPAFNETPRHVGPRYNYKFVVSDDQLSAVLQKLHPVFSEVPTKINFVDHAIRMWDDEATFDDESLSGQQMLSLLLDNDEFAKVWGQSMPLVQRSEHGIAVNTQQGRPSVSHVDHLMGTLAEIGVPLSYPVRTPHGKDQVAGILQNAIRNFRVNQREYEWTALAAAFYAQDGRPWYTVEGQEVDFNVMAKRIMRQTQPLGVCYGQHRLYTLTMLLRIDEQIQDKNDEAAHRLLTTQTRREVLDYLQGMTQRLFHSQSLAGYWDGNWPDANKPVPDPDTDPLSRRILATGHVLEWWAMAPQELHPPRETIVKASQWLAKEIIAMDAHKVEKNFTFLSHAGRALALWRDCFPAEFERNYKPQHQEPMQLTQSR